MTLEKRLQQYIQAGNTGVSNDLLLHYQDVGLDNDDLALYMQVERIQGRGDQATPAAIAHDRKNCYYAFAEFDKTRFNAGGRWQYSD